jgi:class 3 adenylate cyclase
VSDPARILVVDDTPMNVKLLHDLLEVQGYAVETAVSGEEGLTKVADWNPDLVLLDVMMPGMSGYEVCEKLRAEPATAALPVVLVTALDPDKERLRGLEAGADDFLTKPVNQAELLARVRSLLRIKTLHDEVQEQAAELARWNSELETRVAAQVDELDRLGRLRRFLSPQVADAVVSSGEDELLGSHRALIATVFCDLRGFTRFCESAEPEEAIEVLQAYHEAMGRLIHEHRGTIDHRAGDGIMVIFNDPLSCDDPAGAALSMALSMRARMDELGAEWRKLGHRLGFGVGISLGYATVGMVGFEGRYDYTANGSVVNLAARLCDEAGEGEILLSTRAYAAVEDRVQVGPAVEITLKGFHEPVQVFRVKAAREDSPRGPQ